jgi:hypothetical protein
MTKNRYTTKNRFATKILVANLLTFKVFDCIIRFATGWQPVGNQFATSWQPVCNQLQPKKGGGKL